jgi:hypothetical protein
MLIKGAALISSYLPDVGVRPMSDVDVLVHPSDVDRTVAVLEDLEWRLLEGQSLARMMRTRHSSPLTGGESRNVDLHWSPLWEPGDDEDLWRLARPAALGSATTLVPCATDQLVIACVHGVHWWGAPVRWIADVALLLSNGAGDIDWALLERRAHERRLEIVLAQTLTFVSRLLEVPVPAETLARLGAAPVTPADRFINRVKMAPPRRGKFYVASWDRSRRLRRAQPSHVGRAGFLDHIVERQELPNRRALLPAVVGRAVDIARYGPSEPSGPPATRWAAVGRRRSGGDR